MAEHDPQRTQAQSLTCGHIITHRLCQEFSADQACGARPTGKADDHHDHENVATRHGHDHQDQDERREAHHDLDQALQQQIDPTTEIPAEGSDQRADQQRQSGGNQAHGETDACSSKHLRGDILSCRIATRPKATTTRVINRQWPFQDLIRHRCRGAKGYDGKHR